jgi:hypothetical protein
MQAMNFFGNAQCGIKRQLARISDLIDGLDSAFRIRKLSLCENAHKEEMFHVWR